VLQLSEMVFMLRFSSSLFAILAFTLFGASAHANVVVVLNSRDASVSLLDQAAYQEIGTVAVGKEPHHLMATPDNKSLIVGSATGNELIFLDPKSGQIQRRVKDILDPYQFGFTPDQKWFVSNALRLDHVDIYRYDGKDLALTKRLPLGKLPSHMAFSADSKMVFVTLQGSDKVTAIDLESQQVKWTIPVGKLPAGIAMTADDKYLLVGIMGSDYVEVIDWRAAKTVKKIKVGEGAHNFRAMGNQRHIFVGSRVSNTISIVDEQTLENVGTIDVPGGPDDMELTDDGKYLWVTLRWVKKVAVIDVAAKKVIKTIGVGRSPHGIYFANHAPRM
jgi:YVTN family beta-propeller protein